MCPHSKGFAASGSHPGTVPEAAQPFWVLQEGPLWSGQAPLMQTQRPYDEHDFLGGQKGGGTSKQGMELPGLGMGSAETHLCVLGSP